VNYAVSEKKGESLRVGLREIGEGEYEVTIGGELVQVDAVRSGRTIYSVIENGQQFEAVVDEKGAHGFDVLIGGRIFHLESVDERTRLLAGSAVSVASGPQTVAAEMPGKVVNLAHRRRHRRDRRLRGRHRRGGRNAVRGRTARAGRLSGDLGPPRPARHRHRQRRR
jgi:hypothetical protein